MLQRELWNVSTGEIKASQVAIVDYVLDFESSISVHNFATLKKEADTEVVALTLIIGKMTPMETPRRKSFFIREPHSPTRHATAMDTPPESLESDEDCKYLELDSGLQFLKISL